MIFRIQILIVLCIVIVHGAKKKNHIIKSNSRDIYELRMQRNVKDYEVKIEEKVTQPIFNCDKYHQSLFHNSSWSTQLCFEKDLSYTIEATIGNPKQKNYEYINLQVDINQPWSWVKGKNCKSCEELDKYSFQSLQNAQCDGDCKYQQYNSVQKYDPLKTKQNNNQTKQAAITGMDQGLFGTFFYDRLSFLAYNANKNVTIKNTLKEKLSLGSYNALEDLITIEKMKFLQAQKMVNYEEYIGDGALGLARLDIEYDFKNIEPDTNMLKLLLENENTLEQGDFVFGIYLKRQGKDIADFALTLGGYNAEYSQDVDIASYFVNMKVNKNKDLKEITLFGQSFPLTEAYFTMSQTFMLLPLETVNKMIEFLNKDYSMDCMIVDNKYLIVFCTNVVPKNYYDKTIDFKFDGLAINMSFIDLLRTCKHEYKSLFNQDISQSVPNYCLLNIAVSPSKKVILGEAFLNKHYTIFDLKNNRIGFLPPQNVNFFSDEDEKRQIVEFLMKVVTIVFVVGIMSLFFMKSILRCSNRFIEFILRIIDAQKLEPYQSRGQNQSFSKLNQNEGFEIQNNQSEHSLEIQEENKHITTHPNAINGLNKPQQKRKIFQSSSNTASLNISNQLQQTQLNITQQTTPDQKHMDLL